MAPRWFIWPLTLWKANLHPPPLRQTRKPSLLKGRSTYFSEQVQVICLEFMPQNDHWSLQSSRDGRPCESPAPSPRLPAGRISLWRYNFHSDEGCVYRIHSFWASSTTCIRCCCLHCWGSAPSSVLGRGMLGRLSGIQLEHASFRGSSSNTPLFADPARTRRLSRIQHPRSLWLRRRGSVRVRGPARPVSGVPQRGAHWPRPRRTVADPSLCDPSRSGFLPSRRGGKAGGGAGGSK